MSARYHEACARVAGALAVHRICSDVDAARWLSGDRAGMSTGETVRAILDVPPGNAWIGVMVTRGWITTEDARALRGEA